MKKKPTIEEFLGNGLRYEYQSQTFKTRDGKTILSLWDWSELNEAFDDAEDANQFRRELSEFFTIAINNRLEMMRINSELSGHNDKPRVSIGIGSLLLTPVPQIKWDELPVYEAMIDDAIKESKDRPMERFSMDCGIGFMITNAHRIHSNHKMIKADDWIDHELSALEQHRKQYIEHERQRVQTMVHCFILAHPNADTAFIGMQSNTDGVSYTIRLDEAVPTHLEAIWQVDLQKAKADPSLLYGIPELRPCPYCNGPARIVDWQAGPYPDNDPNLKFGIGCTNAGCLGHETFERNYQTPARAAYEWNRQWHLSSFYMISNVKGHDDDWHRA